MVVIEPPIVSTNIFNGSGFPCTLRRAVNNSKLNRLPVLAWSLIPSWILRVMSAS